MHVPHPTVFVPREVCPQIRMFISAFLTFCERLRFHVRQSPLLLSMSATPVRKFDRLSLPRFEYYRVLAIGNKSLFGLLVFIL